MIIFVRTHMCERVCVWIANEIPIDFNWKKYHTHAFQIDTVWLRPHCTATYSGNGKSTKLTLQRTSTSWNDSCLFCSTRVCLNLMVLYTFITIVYSDPSGFNWIDSEFSSGARFRFKARPWQFQIGKSVWPLFRRIVRPLIQSIEYFSTGKWLNVTMRKYSAIVPYEVYIVAFISFHPIQLAQYSQFAHAEQYAQLQLYIRMGWGAFARVSNHALVPCWPHYTWTFSGIWTFTIHHGCRTRTFYTLQYIEMHW